MKINLDKLIIDRVVDGQFENKDGDLVAILDQLQNFSINNSTETKDKTDAKGTLLKRYYTAKNAEVSGENAVFSMNLMSLQTGANIIKDSDVIMPRILQVEKSDAPVKLPDIPIEGTLSVYGTYDDGLPDTELKYVRGTVAGAGTYAVSTIDGVTSIALPTDATASVQIKYDRQIQQGVSATRVEQNASSLPKEFKATFRVLCSDICSEESVICLYICFPRLQVSPDFDWTVDTESAQPFSGQALQSYCARNKLLYYVAVAEDTEGYDTEVDKPIVLPTVDPDAPVTEVTVTAMPGTATVFGTDVSDLQNDISISDGAITGTLKKLTNGDLVDAWGEGNFIALQFSDIPSDATSVKVGLDPSAGSGLVEIINDPDLNGAFKVSNTSQKFKVVTTTPDGENTQTFDLSGLTLEA